MSKQLKKSFGRSEFSGHFAAFKISIDLAKRILFPFDLIHNLHPCTRGGLFTQMVPVMQTGKKEIELELAQITNRVLWSQKF